MQAVQGVHADYMAEQKSEKHNKQTSLTQSYKERVGCGEEKKLTLLISRFEIQF